MMSDYWYVIPSYNPSSQLEIIVKDILHKTRDNIIIYGGLGREDQGA